MGTLTSGLFKKQCASAWFSNLTTEERDRLCDKHDYPRCGSGFLLNGMVDNMYQEEVNNSI